MLKKSEGLNGTSNTIPESFKEVENKDYNIKYSWNEEYNKFIIGKGKIIAKTIQENEITKFISQEWQMDLASDAIGSNAYDGKNDTIAKGNRDDIPENVTAGKVSNARFNIDNSAWGKTISIYSYL